MAAPRPGSRRAPAENKVSVRKAPWSPSAPKRALRTPGGTPKRGPRQDRCPLHPATVLTSPGILHPHPGAVVFSDLPPNATPRGRQHGAPSWAAGLPCGGSANPRPLPEQGPRSPRPSAPPTVAAGQGPAHTPASRSDPKVSGCRVEKGVAGGSDVRLAHFGAERYLQGLSNCCQAPRQARVSCGRAKARRRASRDGVGETERWRKGTRRTMGADTGGERHLPAGEGARTLAPGLLSNLSVV